MNTLFLVNEELKDTNGISKKILAQVTALKHLGLKVAFCYLKANEKNEFTGRFIDGEILDKYSSISILRKIQWRYQYKNLYRYVKDRQIKLVYIRYTHFANPFFISFLKKLKKDGIITLLELPSYPYEQEYRHVNFIDKIILSLEKLSRRKFKDSITRIITLSRDSSIFQVPTIQISNGFDTNSVDTVQKRKPDGVIRLIAVASMTYWHGYDRVIEGLHNYYNNNCPGKIKVIFDLVGCDSGNDSLRYKELAAQYDLNDYVNFHERLCGKDLDTLFNQADIAVGCLACHRKGMEYSRSLKNREYCARGIPFFYSEIDEDIEGQNFILKISANDDPVNINEVLDFLANSNLDPDKIRSFAVDNLTWEKQFQRVLSEVMGELNSAPRLPM